MRFVVIATLLAGALASPVTPESNFNEEDDAGFGQDSEYHRSDAYQPCSGAGFFGTTPTCCSVDIIGAASIGCRAPARNPRSPAEFQALCGSRKPKCCFLDPVGGVVNAICPNPVGF